ncbi:hypothetical protein BJ170DRAFT_689441 [Xylariales sp. AK1849]|nr:hypothetical protein BJ170DRAFT_689441 [Xylariales sp. AK1849]
MPSTRITATMPLRNGIYPRTGDLEELAQYRRDAWTEKKQSCEGKRPRGLSILGTKKPCCRCWDPKTFQCEDHLGPTVDGYILQYRGKREDYRRAYAVSIWAMDKRHQNEIKALNEKRREDLGLQELPPDQDYPHCPLSNRRDRKKYLGNLCLSHSINHESTHVIHSSEKCFPCNQRRLQTQQEERKEALYDEHDTKCFLAYLECTKYVGTELVSWHPPSRVPKKERSDLRTRKFHILHVTDWTENAKGESGNRLKAARYRAETTDKRHHEVWEGLGLEDIEEVTV